MSHAIHKAALAALGGSAHVSAALELLPGTASPRPVSKAELKGMPAPSSGEKRKDALPIKVEAATTDAVRRLTRPHRCRPELGC